MVESISDAYLELATKVISPSPASFIPATPVMTMFSSPAISPPTRAPISLSETSIRYLLFYPGPAERAEERRNRANSALLGNLPPLKKLSLVSGNQLPLIKSNFRARPLFFPCHGHILVPKCPESVRLRLCLFLAVFCFACSTCGNLTTSYV